MDPSFRFDEKDSLDTLLEQREPPTPPKPFENDRVEAASVEDFLERYYKHDRYRGRGEDYASSVLASHENHFEKYGYDIISRHESVTGKVVAYFSPD